MKKKLIFFDLGLTLVKNKNTQIYKEILQHQGYEYSQNEVDRAYHYANKHYMKNYPGLLGKPREHYIHGYVELMMDYLKISNNTNEFIENLCTYSKESFIWEKFPFTDDVLDMLNKKGLRTGIISNWDNSCRSVLKENNILNKMDVVIVSEEEGIEKPDEKIFKIALNKANVDADDCIYVGDNYYDDVNGARKVNMDCLLINPYGKFGIEELDYANVISDIREIENYI